MFNCPTILNLKLDTLSRSGIDKINSIIELTQIGASIMAGGTVARLLTRSEPLEMAFNLSQYDWQLFAETTNAWSKIQRNRIEEVARNQAFDHMHDRAQFEFWRAIADGCAF